MRSSWFRYLVLVVSNWQQSKPISVIEITLPAGEYK